MKKTMILRIYLTGMTIIFMWNDSDNGLIISLYNDGHAHVYQAVQIRCILITILVSHGFQHVFDFHGT